MQECRNAFELQFAVYIWAVKIRVRYHKLLSFRGPSVSGSK